jgi:DNA-binding MarR family transcriptional regulator
VARDRSAANPGKTANAANEVSELDIDAVMFASRAFVALAARSLTPVENVVTLTQWRALVVISAQQRASLNEVAIGLGVHPSTATRICDRLVASGLLLRQDDPADRRYLVLSLTRKGQRLVDKVTAARRGEIKRILERLDGPHRHRLAVALQEFAVATGESPDHLWDVPVETALG